MSLSSSYEIACPHCGQAQTLDIYSTVNVTVDPSLKMKVVSGTLNHKNCEKCGEEINVFTPLLYNDMEKKLLINFKGDDAETSSDIKEMIDQFKQEKFIYREVNSYEELVEKIRIFQFGLNDQVMGQIVAELKTQLAEATRDMEGIEVNIFFHHLKKGLFGGKKLVFQCYSHPEQIMELEYGIKKLGTQQTEDLFNIEVLRQ